MHSDYKLDESVLRRIISKEVSVIHPNNNVLKLYIYYKNLKLFNLVIANNRTRKKDDILQQTNLVYQFKCPLPHSKVEQYIGHTKTKLSRRLTMHLQSGSIRQHFETIHHRKLTREVLVANSNIVVKEYDPLRLKIKEALYIQKLCPSINKQFEKFSTTLRHCFTTEF